MPNDDAVDTVNSLIDRSRSVISGLAQPAEPKGGHVLPAGALLAVTHLNTVVQAMADRKPDTDWNDYFEARERLIGACLRGLP